MLRLRFPGEAHDRMGEISDAVASALEVLREVRIYIGVEGRLIFVLVPGTDDPPGLLNPNFIIVTDASEECLVGELEAAAVYYSSRAFRANQVLEFIGELCEINSPLGDRWLRAALERETREREWFVRMTGDGDGVRPILADVMVVLRAHGKTSAAPDPYTKMELPSGEEIEW